MSVTRYLGFTMLWVGFLTAAVAMVSRREVDLLPDVELVALESIPAELVISNVELQELSQTPIDQQSTEDFLDMVSKLLDRGNGETSPEAPAEQSTTPATGGLLPGSPPEAAAEVVAVAGRPTPRQWDKNTFTQWRLHAQSSLWGTIAWPAYIAGLVTGLIGVILLRTAPAPAELASNDQGESLRSPSVLLSLVLERMTELAEKLPDMTPEAVVDYIDEQCVGACNDFAEQREDLRTQHGLELFAAIMTEFASGERQMNRVWSAAADGYMEEAWRSARSSAEYFAAANAILQQASSQSKRGGP